ncbi:hypothetical protein PVK06_026616 [Gossypium arboreum]|uniref:Uncharacterized protein n=1 Tax=Gossypium arboreum TaxID=29729 RepID=A0ABR0NY53_GOSAR|nr:hypothetical protein PVK06_026616 [Gossypium arboreum]
MVSEAPARPGAEVADGARGSRTTKGLGCRWCPKLLHIQAPRCRWCPRFSHDQGLGCRWCPRLPQDQGPRLPMVSKALAHLSTKVADGARGSCMTKGLGCRCCPRLPQDQGPRCRWWPRLPHDQGPRLPMVPEAPA